MGEELGNLLECRLQIFIVIFNEKRYAGVTNIRKRPTIDNDDNISIETNILDFNGDIYDQTIEIHLVKFLRLTQKFQNLSQLRAQFIIDCQIARKFLGLSYQEQFIVQEKQSQEIFEVLSLLAKHPGWAYSKEQIYEQVWKEPSNGYCHPVENTISKLRKKLQQNKTDSLYIKTIVGYGYKFNEPDA